MDDAIVVATIAAVPAVLSAVLAYKASTAGRRNEQTLARVEKQTNGEMDRKIERAVRRVFADDPSAVTGAVVAEAVRDLLDGILEAAADNNGSTP